MLSMDGTLVKLKGRKRRPRRKLRLKNRDARIERLWDLLLKPTLND